MLKQQAGSFAANFLTHVLSPETATMIATTFMLLLEATAKAFEEKERQRPLSLSSSLHRRAEKTTTTTTTMP